MDGSRKRKATNATPSSGDGSASKKLRLLNSSAPATKSTVQQVGDKLLDQLHNATDKNGRAIATMFIALPERETIPEYYEIIKLPVALDTIEEKLKRDAYPTVTALESDFKRLIQNAKDFNDPKSEIYEDAERIRKLVFNYMKIHNPAYRDDPRYTAQPTPIPQSKPTLVLKNAKKESSTATPEAREASEQPKLPPSARGSVQPPEKQESVAPSAGTGAKDEDDEDEGEEAGGDDIEFVGKTFQEAQQMMIAYLLTYKDAEGLEVYFPFGNLPTRKLEDYYKIIRHPVSLKSVAKRARGQHGRAPPSGVTDFKTWDAFEEEVSFIWRNAQEYNEDGSDMYNLAAEFKEHFQSLLAEAKEKVEEPAGPKLKLGGPKPKVMLSLNQGQAQGRSSPAPGVSVDNDALLRQRQMVQAGVNGQQTNQPQLTNGTGSTLARPSSSTHSGSPVGTSIKFEKTSTQSPGPPNGTYPPPALTNGMMLPPTLRPTSSAPYAPLPAPSYTHPSLLPPTPLRTSSVDNALLPSVTINTHPHLKIQQPFNISIPPHPTLSHQSTTITLPSSHYFLQIQPTISKELSLMRPYKLFVTVNGTRLTQKDTQWSGGSGRRTHLYEGSLAQGVNRVEIEVAAAKREGAGEGLEVEKVGVFVYLTR